MLGLFISLWSLTGTLPPNYPALLSWWARHAMIAPVYAVFAAPVIGLIIRQAVWRQREFLADADAVLLTRDPEGLALALVNIGTPTGERLRVGESIMHLYFVDPMQEANWLHWIFPSHPPLEKRVAMLMRMSDGTAPAANRDWTIAKPRPVGPGRQTAGQSGWDQETEPL
jgi:Zn-dependent protease with chaperone function